LPVDSCRFEHQPHAGAIEEDEVAEAKQQRQAKGVAIEKRSAALGIDTCSAIGRDRARSSPPATELIARRPRSAACA